MVPPYSNGHGHGHGPPHNFQPRRYHDDEVDDCEAIVSRLAGCCGAAWAFCKGRGRRLALALVLHTARWAVYQVRWNLSWRRLLSLPHLLVCFWAVVLVWGERWIFVTRVDSCQWSSWENWPSGANPHHLIFIADPQLIDPHSYPGRPWPLSSLTVLLTDNYLRRGYNELQGQLRPDSIFFLGDLFDGGREWKTSHGDFNDPDWARGHRPAREQKYVKSWNKKYGEDFWLREYSRFGNIFFKPWEQLAERAGDWQRGRKMVASLPGNHDLGFGSEIKIPVRDRFAAYFGESNRIDIVGNHTIVSVDTVSLSAGTSDEMRDSKIDLKPIYYPPLLFLQDVKAAKRKAVEMELRFWRGEVPEVRLENHVEAIDSAKPIFRSVDPGEGKGADFPTILLTHVPLYRDPGTPCGPLREHWPPQQPPRGQSDPVDPDFRNAISVARGYQYQNVLSEEDSVKLVDMVGNVAHVFSGDDHDYCDVVHGPSKHRVREITVKSMSMAMGVPTPGFLMASLWNPVGPDGQPLPGAAPGPTIQTHLCLLPNQIATYTKYAALVLVSLAILAVRAALVPALRLHPFADPTEPGARLLPNFKDKPAGRDRGPYHHRPAGSSSSGTLAPRQAAARFGSRARSPSGAADAGSGRAARAPGKWGWGGPRAPPRIEISTDDFYDGGKSRAGAWRAATARGRGTLRVVAGEMWATTWRVAWMVVLLWSYMAWKG